MIIRNVEFLTSFSDSGAYLSKGYESPEICVVGRSNVGKSSFINTIVGAKVAYTSSQPGRTRLINVFGVNKGEFNIVDLPGYGYAKAPKSEQSKWQNMIEGYLTGSANLRQIFGLIDIRHEPTALDELMFDYMYKLGLPFTVVATKSDKISGAEKARNIMRISSVLGVGRDEIIPFSSVKRDGKDAVLKRIESILNR